MTRRLLLPAIALAFPAGFADAGWNPFAGIKDGTESDVEPSALYVGPGLNVSDGSLTFLGDAFVTGEVLLRSLDAGTDTVVETVGAFSADAPGRSFRVEDAARFTVGDTSRGSIRARNVFLLEGAVAVTPGAVVGKDGVSVADTGTSWSVGGDLAVEGGSLGVERDGSLAIDGALMMNSPTAVLNAFDGGTISIGNPTASSLRLDRITLGDGAQLQVGSVDTENVVVSDAGFSTFDDLLILGGELVVNQTGAVDVGSFLQMNSPRNQLVVAGGASFSVGDASQGSVVAGRIDLSGDVNMTLPSTRVTGQLAVGTGFLSVAGAGTEVRVAGDLTQETGTFIVQVGATLRVDRTLTKTSPSENFIVDDMSRVIVGQPTTPTPVGTTHLGVGGAFVGSGDVTGGLINEGVVEVDPWDTPLVMTTVYQQDAGGELRLTLVSPTVWSSVEAALVILNGTLEVSLTNEFSQPFVPTPGDEFEIVTATGTGAVVGQFDTPQVADLAGDQLVTFDLVYQPTTVRLRVATVADFLPGDYNRDGFVNAADFTVWRDTDGDDAATRYAGADGNGDGVVSSADYDIWLANYGRSAPMVTAVPEPSAAGLLMGLLAMRSGRARRHSPDWICT